jgi:hypothetical protein
MRVRPGALVVVHLSNPTEKFWGVLQELAMSGVYLRGISIDSFDDWMAQAVRGKDQTLGLCAMYVPLFRVERVFLDEPVGEVESYQQRFVGRVGIPVRRYLGIPDEDGEGGEGGAAEPAEIPS